jgi:hypothetical protein
MRPTPATVVRTRRSKAMRPTPATAVPIRRSKGMRLPTIVATRRNRNLEAIRRRAIPTPRRQHEPIPRQAGLILHPAELTLRLAAAMEVVAARRTAAVAVLLRTAAEVVVAEADRIVDPVTFPKGPPISSRRAFGFLGLCLLPKSLPTTLRWMACSIDSSNPGVSKFDKASGPSSGGSPENVIV